MKNIYKLLIALIASIFVLGISYLSFRTQTEMNEKIAPEILNNLILPYSELLKQERYQEAYEKLTSTSYKKKHSLYEYLSAQEKNKEYFGNLISMELTSGIFIKMSDKDNKWIYRGTIDYNASKIKTKFTLDAVIENGKFKIARTYPSQISLGNPKPMIF